MICVSVEMTSNIMNDCIVCPHIHGLSNQVSINGEMVFCYRGKWSPENLQKMTHEAVNVTHQYVLSTYEWIVERVESVNKVH